MADTASRNPVGGPQLLADALLRSVAGATATLRMAGAIADSTQTEMGIAPTPFTCVVVSPVVMRKLRPALPAGETAKWELLVSATSVAQQVNVVSVGSAEALFAMTLAITIAGQDYFIDSVAANEAFGQVYLYRLTLSEARQQGI